jgi:putative membrane protein
MMWDHGWGAGSWLLMSFMMWVLSGLVIAGVLWLVRGHRLPQPRDAAQARQILDGRFARGEIDEADYATRRDQLAAR